MIVNDSKELSSALRAGGQIKLAPGSYSLKAYGRTWAEIVPQNPDSPPILSEIALTACENITIKGVRVESDQRTAVNLNKCKGIRFEDCTATGAATGYVGAEAPRPASFADVIRSSDIHFTRCNISRWWSGITFRECSDISVTWCNIRELCADGIRMASVEKVLIASNFIGGFYGSLYRRNHDDFIQIWAIDGPSKGVAIVGNMLDSLGMAATQSIFIRNEAYERTGALHEDVVIVGNSVRNGHQHGILAEHTNGLVMQANSLSWDKEAVMRKDSGEANSQPGFSAIGEAIGAAIRGNVRG